MNEFQRYLSSLNQEYRLNHGIHHWCLPEGSLAAVSASTWTDFRELMEQIDERSPFVVSPELITAAEEGSDIVDPVIIQKRICELQDISQRVPDTTILLGTPSFESRGKPKNSVLYLRDGNVIGQTHKRAPATQWERDNFTFEAEEPPSIIPGTSMGVLICSDLALISLYDRPSYDLNATLRLIGKSNLIGKAPRFIHDEAQSLVVVSCWGVGSQFGRGYDPDEYYQFQLQCIAASVLRNTEQIRQIVMVDRTSASSGSDDFHASIPFNVSFSERM
jgi:hypothetical protein